MWVGRRLVALGVGLASVLAVAAGQGAAADDAGCECGRVGEDCAQTGFLDRSGELKLVPVDTFPGGQCQRERATNCFVFKGEAKCACVVGWRGPLCDEPIVASPWNLALAGVMLPSVVIAGAVVLLRRRFRRTGGSDWDVPPAATVQGLASPKVVLAYRVIVAVFCTVVIIDQMVDAQSQPGNASWKYRFYTVWNFHLVVLYFALGSWLSWKAVFGRQEPRDPPARLNTMERVFFVIMEVELSSALVVTVVVWALLLPQSFSRGLEHKVLQFRSYVQHGAQFLFMLGDYAMNGLRFQRAHVLFMVIWACSYAITHSLVMAVEMAQGMVHRPSYPFLSSATPFSALALFGLLAVMIVTYALCTLLDRIKPEAATNHSGATAGGKAATTETLTNSPAQEGENEC